jgi:carbonic anhydrase
MCSHPLLVLAPLAALLLTSACDNAAAPSPSVVSAAPNTVRAPARLQSANERLASARLAGIVKDDGGPLWTLLGESPIDIPLTTTRKLLSTDPRFAWMPFVPDIEGAGIASGPARELKVSTNDMAGSITIRGTVYTLRQFHFHRESEHAINGRKRAMEVHFVHTSDGGAIAVIGVLLELGRTNPALEPIWPAGADVGVAVPGAPFDPGTLLPPTSTPYFTYSGSLTTNPFTTGLTWIVYKQPITLSAQQLQRYMQAYPEENVRPLQPLGDRTVFERVGGGR